MFLSRIPNANNPLLFGEWPFYIINCTIIGIVLMLIAKLPFDIKKILFKTWTVYYLLLFYFNVLILLMFNNLFLKVISIKGDYDLGLFILRIFIGLLMFLNHGIGKITAGSDR